ncbi:hypothetical protein F5Y12DRAFT_762393 [Xylaria sp. FL1777]|nr:hypothetical protein F5Y12DRAFT_762393 [Xylaria sp. FL1777]
MDPAPLLNLVIICCFNSAATSPLSSFFLSIAASSLRVMNFAISAELSELVMINGVAFFSQSAISATSRLEIKTFTTLEESSTIRFSTPRSSRLSSTSSIPSKNICIG